MDQRRNNNLMDLSLSNEEDAMLEKLETPGKVISYDKSDELD